MKEYVFAFLSACVFFFVGCAASIIIGVVLVSIAWEWNFFVFVFFYLAFLILLPPLVGGYVSYILTKKYFYVISGLLVAVLCAVASLAVLGIVIEIYEIITNTPLHKRGNYRFLLKIMAVPALIGILLAGLVSASGPEKPQRPIIPF